MTPEEKLWNTVFSTPARTAWLPGFLAVKITACIYTVPGTDIIEVLTAPGK